MNKTIIIGLCILLVVLVGCTEYRPAYEQMPNPPPRTSEWNLCDEQDDCPEQKLVCEVKESPRHCVKGYKECERIAKLDYSMEKPTCKYNEPPYNNKMCGCKSFNYIEEKYIEKNHSLMVTNNTRWTTIERIFKLKEEI